MLPRIIEQLLGAKGRSITPLVEVVSIPLVAAGATGVVTTEQPTNDQVALAYWIGFGLTLPNCLTVNIMVAGVQLLNARLTPELKAHGISLLQFYDAGSPLTWLVQNNDSVEHYFQATLHAISFSNVEEQRDAVDLMDGMSGEVRDQLLAVIKGSAAVSGASGGRSGVTSLGGQDFTRKLPL